MYLFVRVLVLMMIAGIITSAQTPQTSGKYQVSLQLPSEGLVAGIEQQIVFHIEDLESKNAVSGADRARTCVNACHAGHVYR